jgi:hypothetical protein
VVKSIEPLAAFLRLYRQGRDRPCVKALDRDWLAGLFAVTVPDLPQLCGLKEDATLRRRGCAMLRWDAQLEEANQQRAELENRISALKQELDADSGDCGQVFRLIADSDSDRSRTAFR